MRREPNFVANTVVLALSVLGIVFPAIFMRNFTSWAILLFRAPFGMLMLTGVWLLLGGFGPAPSEDA